MRRFTVFVLSVLMGMLAWAVGEFFHAFPSNSVAHVFAVIFLLVAVFGFCDDAFEKRFWLTFVGCSGALAISAVVFIAIIAFANKSPEESLQAARSTYLNHDLASFKDYVDVNAILSDGVDQMIVSPALHDAQQTSSVVEGLVAAGVALTAASWQETDLPELSKEIEQFVVTGSVPNQSQSDSFGIALGSEFLRTFVASQLTYRGIAETRQSSESIVLITVRTEDSGGHPLLVTFKLRAKETHWQIVGVQNLPELFKQLAS